MLPFNEDSDISASDPEGLGSELEAPGSVPGICAAIVSLSFLSKQGSPMLWKVESTGARSREWSILLGYAMNADQSRFESELFWGGGVL